MQPYPASIAPLTGQPRQRGWLYAGLFASAVVLATVLPSAALPLLLPGGNVALTGATGPTGTVDREALLPFEIRDGSGQLLISGNVQDRVVKVTSNGLFCFEPQLRDLTVSPAGTGFYILGIKLTGYNDTTTHVEYASSGTGTIGPSNATRDISGDEVTFLYTPGSLVAPGGSRFCYIETNAPAYRLTGRITITARNVGGQTFSTTIEGTAAPTRLQVFSGGVIQAAIDAAAPGETVFVNPGTYTESLILRSGIKVKGAGAGLVTLLSPTNPGVLIASCTNTEFSGFTVTPAPDSTATTGIEVNASSPLVKNNIVTGFGHCGIYLWNASTAIVCDNRVQNNRDSGNGLLDYGIMCLSSKPLISNNLISGNETGCYIGLHQSDGAQFINNTVVGNSSEGLWCYCSNPGVKNNIVTGNETGISVSTDDATPILTCNDVWNNSFSNYYSQDTGVINIGTGSISVDPLFLTTAPGDYKLAPASPCRNTGDPAAIGNDLDGSRNDMGWTGGPCASPEESAAPFGGFLFTSVGNIPASHVGTDGLATVSASDAAALKIPAWDHAAFGSQPWLFGVFGSGVVNAQYYMIECKPDGTPDSSFAPLDHPLSKVKYTVTGTGVTTTLESVGPVWSGGVPYFNTTTNGGNVYWANDSLRLVLNSPQLAAGTYNLRLKAFDATFFPIALTGPSNSLTLTINNKPPTVSILSIARASGALISECGIVGLTGSQESLRFRITASHPDGFMDSYSLTALVGHNRYAGTIASASHAESHSGETSWTGSTDTPFETLPAMMSPPRLDPWISCAYQFRLGAWARITNGYGLIYYNECFWNLAMNLNRADLDGDGDVDGDDLNIFAGAYGTSNN